MIKNNLLENHLNNFKSGKPIKMPTNEEKNISAIPIQHKNEESIKKQVSPVNPNLYIVIYQILEILFKSIIFGLSIKTLLNKQWSNEAMFAVGFTFNYILFYTYKLFKRK